MSAIESSKEVTLTWKGLTAYAKDKAILNNCEGYCQPGEMLAIMGPSGAGKTTLLSLLSQRNNPSLNIQGSILANGQPFTQKSFYSFGTFVYQNDLLLSTLTVRETLEFAANLKIQDQQQAQKKVNQLLEEFELQKTENVYIGNQIMKGISGGEKKRVCIAVEMVSKPSLIILDQPTSGLDSNKAAKVLSILKKLTSLRHTIVFTLHQPSYLQYIKLDRLVLLNQGQTVYQGPANQIEPYMQSIGINVSRTSTISDFFMFQISESRRLAKNYESPLNYQNYSLNLSEGIKTKIDELNAKKGDLHIFRDIFQASFIFAEAMLLKREWKTYWRDKMKFGAMILNTVVKFILVGILFKDAVPSRQETNANPVLALTQAQSVAFICITSTIMTAINTVALSIPLQRELFYKECDSKKYSALPYYLGKVLIFLFSNIVSSIVYCATAYWLNGWTNDFDHWLNFTLVIILLTGSGCSLGFFCAALFKNISRVSALTSVFLVPMFVLAGMFKKLDNLPVWIDWLQYATPFRYGFQLIMQNQYRDEKFGPGGIYDYASDLGYTLNYSQNFVVLLALTVAFYFFGFLLLKYNADKIVA